MPTTAPPAPAEPLALSISDIAQRTSMSVRTIERLIADGRFPPADLRIGRRCVRWRTATVLAALDRLAGEE